MKKGGRKYVAILVRYEVDFLEATLNGVQGVGDPNAVAPIADFKVGYWDVINI